MYGARFNLTDQGVMHAQLVADTAYFFDDNTRIELIRVNVTFFSATGLKNAVLTSRRGTYHTATGLMVGRGDVVVNSEDGRRLRSEELKFDQSRNEISSDSAFVLTEPERRLEGIGFRSDPNLQNVHVLKTLSGTAGVVTIPNQ
jgi:LPS export ABC transporter protein LptC